MAPTETTPYPSAEINPNLPAEDDVPELVESKQLPEAEPSVSKVETRLRKVVYVPCPNERIMKVHTNWNLLPEAQDIVAGLLRVDGLTEKHDPEHFDHFLVKPKKYVQGLHRARMFSWDEIIPHVNAVLKVDEWTREYIYSIDE